LNIKNYQNQIKNKRKQERERLQKAKLQKQKLAKIAKKKINISIKSQMLIARNFPDRA
jgi:hypothetical protein